MADDQANIAKLEELLAKIGDYEDPRRASTEWKQVFKLLQETPVPPSQIQHVVGMRDVAGLTEMIDQLSAPDAEAAFEGEIPDPEVCKEALKAFRKRLALTVLDEESKLGRSPLTKGAGGSVAQITPPVEYPDAVWLELVRQGKLDYKGHGFYGLGKHE